MNHEVIYFHIILFMVDFLIKGGLIYTMNQNRQVIQDGSIVIEGSEMVAIDETSKIEGIYDADLVIE